MSVKITITDASSRYGVTQRTIQRWTKKYEVHQFEDNTYDRDQLDALTDNYGQTNYMEIDWDRAACKDLPTDFFYKIEERGVAKLIDTEVFRVQCAPCPIWEQCLGYATHHEKYGVWGGMTTEERQSILSHKKSVIKDKVFKDFQKHGINKEMILQAIGRL